MSGKRSSQFQRVSKFAPSTNLVKPNKKTKISPSTLSVHGHAEEKPGSPGVRRTSIVKAGTFGQI